MVLRVSVGEQAAARLKNGDIAQLGEHLPCKQGVESSNLLVSIDSNEQYHCYYIFAFFDNLRKGLIAQPVRAHA